MKGKWREALGQVLADPEVQEKFKVAGLSPFNLDPDEAQNIMLNEVSQWEKVVLDAGMKTN